MRKLIFLTSVFTLLLVIAVSFPVQANQITFFDFTKFNGGAPTPTLKAVITDISGGVTIAMYDLPGTDAEKVQEWYFNLKNPPSLPLNSTRVSGVSADSVTYSSNAYKANGTGGNFDLLFTYDNSGPDVFNVGLNSIYQVLGVTSADFLVLSSDGPYYSAVKQSAWWGDDSFTTVVPEPATLLLIGVGLIGLVGVSRKFRK